MAAVVKNFRKKNQREREREIELRWGGGLAARKKGSIVVHGRPKRMRY